MSSKLLCSQAREMVHTIYNYHIKEQKQFHYLKYKVSETLSDGTSVKSLLVKRIAAEGKQVNRLLPPFIIS